MSFVERKLTGVKILVSGARCTISSGVEAVRSGG